MKSPSLLWAPSGTTSLRALFPSCTAIQITLVRHRAILSTTGWYPTGFSPKKQREIATTDTLSSCNSLVFIEAKQPSVRSSPLAKPRFGEMLPGVVCLTG